MNPTRPALVDDLAATRAAGLDGVVLPKATPGAVETVVDEWRLPTPSSQIRIVALIESAAGLLAAPRIAEHPNVVRLAVGEADLAADLGMSAPPDTDAWLPSRAWAVWASAAAGLPGPVAPVYTDLPDLDGLRSSTVDLAGMGYGARSAIHPPRSPSSTRCSGRRAKSSKRHAGSSPTTTRRWPPGRG